MRSMGLDEEEQEERRKRCVEVKESRKGEKSRQLL